MSKIQLFDHEFNGYKIRQRSEDDYVNITDLAKSEGKRVGDYLALPSTKDYIAALAAKLGALPDDLVTKKRGGKEGGNTYAHPEIAMHCAQWVSMECRLWANNTLVRVVEGDPSLTREQLSRHDDKTAAEEIKHRVKTMEDLDVLEDVQATVQDRIAEVKNILVEAGFRKLSVRRKLGKIYQEIKTKHRHLVDSDRGMVYLKDFLQFADDELVQDLEVLLEYPNQLLVKITPAQMISVTTETTEQFMSRKCRDEGRMMRFSEMSDRPDPSFDFSIFMGA